MSQVQEDTSPYYLVIETSRSDWGFDGESLESNRQRDNPGRSDRLSILDTSCNSWGFDNTVYTALEGQYDGDQRDADVWLGRDQDEEGSSIHSTLESSGPPSVTDMLKALPDSTMDALNSLDIQNMLNLEAQSSTSYGDNLFHVIANPRHHTEVHRHRPWEERLEITRQVIKILVASGLDINAHSYNSGIPLMTAVNDPSIYRYRYATHDLDLDGVKSDGDYDSTSTDLGYPRFGWAEGHTIIALLEEGADPTYDSGEDTILSEWLKIGLYNAPRPPRPEQFDQVLRVILTRFPDINGRYHTWYWDNLEVNGTFLHDLVLSEDDPDYVRLVLHKLQEVELSHPLNIDALDSAGNTPLLQLCIQRFGFSNTRIADNILGIAQALVDAGAKIHFVSAEGVSALTAITTGWHEDRDDNIIAHKIKQLVKMEMGVATTTGHSALIGAAPLSLLAEALYRGHTLTAAVLLKYGMKGKLELERMMHIPPSWLAHDFFNGDDTRISTAVCERLATGQVPSGTRTDLIPSSSGRRWSLSEFAFCGLGRTRLVAWNYSFILSYLIFPLTCSNIRWTVDKYYSGEPCERFRDRGSVLALGLENIESHGYESGSKVDTLDSDSEGDESEPLTGERDGSESTGDSLIHRVYRFTQSDNRERQIERVRPSWRRGHSCPGTERQWRRARLRERREPIPKYYLYSKRQLQEVGCRRNSVPDMDSTLAAGVPLAKLQFYVFRSDGETITSKMTPESEDGYGNAAERWVLGLPRLQAESLIPGILQLRLEELERREEGIGLFGLDAAIDMARQVIESTPDKHPARATWLMRLARGLTTRYEWQSNIDDLEEAIDANREAIKSTPKIHPHWARWLMKLSVNLERLHKRKNESLLLDEVIHTAGQALAAVLENPSFAEPENISRELGSAPLVGLKDPNLAGSLLPLAASKGTVINMLLDTDGVDVSVEVEDGLTPLSLAASYGYEGIVNVLFEIYESDIDNKEKKYGRTPLSFAASNGHRAVVNTLLKTGKVDVDSKDENGCTPLILAASNGHRAMVKMLLDTGKVDVDWKNRDGYTPLSFAASNGHRAVVNTLLKTGKVDVDSKDENGCTPLILAASNGHRAMVKMLLDTGKVDVDWKNRDGYTPLSFAASNGHGPVVQMLLDTGKVNVDWKNRDGYTPLSFAALDGHGAVVKMLLDTGKVDVDWKNNDGHTPLLLAELNGHEDVVKILLDPSKVDVDFGQTGRKSQYI
ncbi:unnamed protein product [Penicillium palitans]